MLYLLVNLNNGLYFKRENQYMNCEETNSVIEAKTYYERQHAEYAASFLKNNYAIMSMTLEELQQAIF